MASSVDEADMGPVSSDIVYGSNDFERISSILNSISGIKMPDSNEALVFSRLSRRVRSLGFSDFSSYVSILEERKDPDELEFMVSALTTNTTRFFREDYHFDIFSQEVLPNLIQRARSGSRVRIWSAGCSTGEEPYSIAAVVLRDFPDALRYDFKILATDIDKNVLSKAVAAQYDLKSVAALNGENENLIFEKNSVSDSSFSVRQDLKDLVTFRYLNFMDPWPVRGPFSAVFCRNVMIYMESDIQSQVWNGLVSILEPGGYLFIGHSERIGNELKDKLKLVGKTSFKKL